MSVKISIHLPIWSPEGFCACARQATSCRIGYNVGDQTVCRCPTLAPTPWPHHRTPPNIGHRVFATKFRTRRQHISPGGFLPWLGNMKSERYYDRWNCILQASGSFLDPWRPQETAKQPCFNFSITSCKINERKVVQILVIPLKGRRVLLKGNMYCPCPGLCLLFELPTETFAHTNRLPRGYGTRKACLREGTINWPLDSYQAGPPTKQIVRRHRANTVRSRYFAVFLKEAVCIS